MKKSYKEACDYAYSIVPKNEKFDIPLGAALIFWAIVIIVIAVVAS